MKKNIIQQKNNLLALLALLGIVNCSERVSFSSFTSKNGTIPPVSSECSGGICKDTFQQIKSFIAEQAAVIISVDLSGSMRDDREPVSKAAAALAKEMAEEGFSKTCFGVMPGIAQNGVSGRLASNANNEYCICADRYSPDQIEDKLLEIFNTFNYNGSGDREAPDHAAYKFLTDPAAFDFNSEKSGQRCAGNETAIFMVGTSDEMSARGALSYTGVTFTRAGDSIRPLDTSESNVRRDFMSVLNPNTNTYDDTFTTQVFKKAFDDYCGTLPCDYSFIGHVTNNGIPSPEEIDTYAKADTQAMAGEYVDILLARSNPSQFVQTFVNQLKPKLKDKLLYLEVFDTKFKICQLKPITVTVDGRDVTQHAEIIGDNRIQLKPPHNRGNFVVVDYVINGSNECGN